MRGSIMKMSAVRSVTAAFVVTAAVAAAHADDVTLQVNQARQRYPWNGLVDIDYTVTYGGGVTLGVDDNLEVLMVDTSVTPAVTGVSASSVARVAIVQLDGTDPDVATWTTEVPGSYRVLKAESGEGEVAWSAKPGVWKATFDILNNDAGIHSETAIFDLRQARARGFVFYVK